MRLKFLLPFMAAVLFCAYTFGQSVIAPTYEFYIYLSDSTALQSVTSSGGQVYPVFNNSNVNAAINSCHLYYFEKAFPKSRFPDMRKYWYVKSDCASLAQNLKNASAVLFPYYESIKAPVTCYTPNDFGPVTGGPMDYLNFVKATQAWTITKGNSNVVIGITDTYADWQGNPDLKNKMAQVRDNTYSPNNEPAHGTMVCGYAAGATDNGTGFPSMGFNSKIDFAEMSGNVHGKMADMSADGRKILNGSWYYYSTATLDSFSNVALQQLYDEIYENGTTTVFAAGNGDAGIGGSHMFAYPASWDHNISVSSVGWLNPYGGSNTFNQQYVHVKNVGDTASHNHNSRVDICAPGLQLAGLDYDPNDTSKHYQYGAGWGTSFASPIVAGAAALMLSERSCLSPYQRECLLKQNANMDSIAIKPENTPYLNKLGAGLLDAGATLNAVHNFDCNDSATQTFIIKGVKVNTICKPGYSSNGVKPVLMPELANGKPPYTYRWMPLPDNSANLDYLNIANPTVIASSGTNTVKYLLTVYDNSPIQKVATKTIKIPLITDSTRWDLAMRDNFADEMDEPGGMTGVDPRDWNVWESPDIWNRQVNDSIMVHQNPEYFNDSANFLYVVVRNIGCKPSPFTTKMTMHWTLASTGEHWPYDWDGTTKFTNLTTGQQLPAGENLDGGGSGSFYVGASLQPGDTILNVHSWHPPKPQAYDPNLTGNTLAVCVLARIMNTNIFPFGMHADEVTNVSTNVKNNNNIVTRNLTVTNLDTANKASTRHMIAFGNPETFTAIYSLQVITDRDIQLHYAGNLSQYAYVTLYLGDLFNVWQANGGHGNYASINKKERTVTYDPSTPLRLDGIRLAPGEKYYIYLDFTIRSSTNGKAPVTDQRIHVRQLANSSDGEYVYGDVSFAVNISTDGRNGKARKANSAIENVSSIHNYEVFPNPVNNLLNIQLTGRDNVVADITVMDITGKTIIVQKGVSLSKSQSYSINTAALQNGAYLIRVNDDTGISESFKITKTN